MLKVGKFAAATIVAATLIGQTAYAQSVSIPIDRSLTYPGCPIGFDRLTDDEVSDSLTRQARWPCSDGSFVGFQMVQDPYGRPIVALVHSYPRTDNQASGNVKAEVVIAGAAFALGYLIRHNGGYGTYGTSDGRGGTTYATPYDEMHDGDYARNCWRNRQRRC